MPEIYNSSNTNPPDQPPGDINQPTSSPAGAAAPNHKRDAVDYSEVMREYPPTTSPLSAFMVRPKRVRLGIQDENETILVILRAHVITNIGWLLVVIVMAAAPLLAGFFPFINFLPLRFSLAAGVLWYLLTLGIALNGLLSWYYNVYVITDERVIDVDFVTLVYKNISAAKIDKIEDVTVQMGGALRSLLNYGTVFIQTAAEKNEFEFIDVPNPQQVAKLLNELMLEEEQEQLEGRAR